MPEKKEFENQKAERVKSNFWGKYLEENCMEIS
jgi:hypothetical protein